MSKQTALQWLVNVVQSCIAPNYIPEEIFKQALQMEREQIEDAHYDGYCAIVCKTKRYYEQTYGGQDESK